ncbi:MAG: GIY-YIG nuclease family protein [Alphaproteobacteria bacterium]
MRSEKRFYIYIVTDKPYGTLYIGVTSDLARRIYEHKAGLYKGFSKTYGLKQLVYHEVQETAEAAFQRETSLKRWRRDWKKQLIESVNPTWRDLYNELA